jgi:uncharacterized membrane protein YeaQ/YmgE (transglycosylase-associated protein family)
MTLPEPRASARVSSRRPATADMTAAVLGRRAMRDRARTGVRRGDHADPHRTERPTRGTRDAPTPGMTTTTLLTWLVVGLIAGVLAGAILGGYGLFADIVVGIVGAFIGGYVFRQAGWHAPIAGLGGTIFVAFVGALILLAVLHLLHSAFHRRGTVA